MREILGDACRGGGMPRPLFLQCLSGKNRRRSLPGQRKRLPVCRGSSQSKGLTEGVYASDMVKAIVRYAPTKSNRTPPPSPSVTPPPTRREAAPRREIFKIPT